MEERSELERSRGETRAAFENRALVYRDIYEVLAEELGRDRATELLKKAIYRRGVDVGSKYKPAAEAGDLAEVGRVFCEGSPCGGTLFRPGIEELTEGGLVLRMEACPLVEAWRDAGLEPDEVDLLCEIAAEVDMGTFEGAGLKLTFEDRLGREGSSRCLLVLQQRDPEEG